MKTIGLCASLAALVGLGAAAGPAPKPYRFVPVVTGLKEPVYVTTPSSQPDNMYIVEKRGRIRVRVGNRLLPKAFLDLRTKVATNTEQGLLSLAFHPQYRRNHRFFVFYTDRRNDLEIVEYRARGYRAIPGSARQVLLVDHPSPNHNGGLLLFGPGGYLYTGIGDGGGAGDPENDAQNLESPLGKLLRLDVNVDPTRVEVVGYGLRNPWRFSFDRANGALYLGDVGQDSFEEIDYTPRRSPGLENYGWHVWEGFSRYTAGRGAQPDGEARVPDRRLRAEGRGAGHWWVRLPRQGGAGCSRTLLLRRLFLGARLEPARRPRARRRPAPRTYLARRASRPSPRIRAASSISSRLRARSSGSAAELGSLGRRLTAG